MELLSLRFLALTFDVLGKLLIAVMALLVHDRIIKEKRIDKKIIKEMMLEKSVAYIAIIFLLIGYILDVYVTT